MTEPKNGSMPAEPMDKVNRTAAELGRQAMKWAEEARKESARGLQKAADRLRQEVRDNDSDEDTVRRVDVLASNLEKTAFYLKDKSVPEMEQQFEDRVKQQPYQALLIAFVIGVVMGVLFPRPRLR